MDNTATNAQDTQAPAQAPQGAQTAPAPSQTPAPVQTQEQTAPAVQEQQIPPAQPQEGQGEPTQPENAEQPKGLGDVFDEKQEGEKKGPEIPESYTFNNAEGKAIEGEEAENYGRLAKGMGLTQEQAQKFYDLTQEHVATMVAKADRIGIEATLSDSEIGGQNLESTRASVSRALTAYATPEFRNVIKTMGLSNNPEILRFLKRVGEGLGQDSRFAGSTVSPKGEPDPYLFYDNSPELMRK